MIATRAAHSDDPHGIEVRAAAIHASTVQISAPSERANGSESPELLPFGPFLAHALAWSVGVGVLGFVLDLGDSTRVVLTFLAFLAALITTTVYGTGEYQSPDRKFKWQKSSGRILFHVFLWLLPFTVAIAAASMRASPAGDLTTPAGLIAVGLGIAWVLISSVGWWLAPIKTLVCTLLLVAVTMHVVIYNDFNRQIESAEADLKRATLSRVRQVLLESPMENGKPNIEVLKRSLGIDQAGVETGLGTLSLRSVSNSRTDAEIRWARRSFLTAISAREVPIAEMDYGRVLTVSEDRLEYENHSSVGSAKVAVKPNRPFQSSELAALKPGATVLVVRSDEPTLRDFQINENVGWISIHGDVIRSPR